VICKYMQCHVDPRSALSARSVAASNSFLAMDHVITAAISAALEAMGKPDIGRQAEPEEMTSLE